MRDRAIQEHDRRYPIRLDVPRPHRLGGGLLRVAYTA